jgi:hypothetical protein
VSIHRLPQVCQISSSLHCLRKCRLSPVVRYGRPLGTLFNVCDFVSKAGEPSGADMNTTPLRFNVRQAINVLASTYLTMGEYLRSEQEMLYVYIVNCHMHARMHTVTDLHVYTKIIMVLSTWMMPSGRRPHGHCSGRSTGCAKYAIFVTQPSLICTCSVFGAAWRLATAARFSSCVLDLDLSLMLCRACRVPSAHAQAAAAPSCRSVQLAYVRAGAVSHRLDGRPSA